MSTSHFSFGYDGLYHPNSIVEAKERFNSKNKIDHIFLWGEGMIEEFKKCLDGKFYKTGSIKIIVLKMKLLIMKMIFCLCPNTKIYIILMKQKSL